MNAEGLAKADAEEAISLRRYRQLRDSEDHRDLTASVVVGSILCSLQVTVLLLSGGLEQPVLAGATLAFCLGVAWLLVLTSLGRRSSLKSLFSWISGTT